MDQEVLLHKQAPDDGRYPAYIPGPGLLWMDSIGIGTDIYLLPTKRVESR